MLVLRVVEGVEPAAAVDRPGDALVVGESEGVTTRPAGEGFDPSERFEASAAE
jgi:hypothetical protein